MPRRRDDDVPGDRALQLLRHPALLQGDRPERRADRRGRAARGGHAHRRRRGEGPDEVPEASRELRLPAPAPERGHGREGARAFPRAPGAERRLGDHELAGRDPLRRAREEGLRRARKGRGVDGLVAAQQPAPLREDGRRERGAGRRSPDRARPGLVAQREQEPARRAEAGQARRQPERRRPVGRRRDRARDAQPGQDPALGRAPRLDRGRQARRPARRLRSSRRRARTPLHPQRARRGARRRQRRPPLRREHGHAKAAGRVCGSGGGGLGRGQSPPPLSDRRRPATRSPGR